jgi:hypothetical protein
VTGTDLRHRFRDVVTGEEEFRAASLECAQIGQLSSGSPHDGSLLPSSTAITSRRASLEVAMVLRNVPFRKE